jgi:hypothetical protein
MGMRNLELKSLGWEVVVRGLIQIRWVSEKLKWNEPD